MIVELLQLTHTVCPECKTLLYRCNALYQCATCGFYLVVKADVNLRDLAGQAMSAELKSNAA